MIALRQIHHVCLRVADLDDAVRRWSIEFGLTERARDGARSLLACGYEPYSLELREDGQPGADHTGFELARDVSVDDAAAHLDALGIPYRREQDALHLSDPDGHGIELVPYRPADDPRPGIARSTTTLRGLRPRRLGHINTFTGDLESVTAFYCEALGMRVADRLEDAGAWLHINADHHTVALVARPPARLHHLAFELADWGELRVALDHVAQHGRWLGWGPVRHGLGQNLAAYVRIPEEHLFVELYADMEQLGPDHEPRNWPDNPHSSNVWGILPPRSFFRFDAAAVEAERHGLEAQGHPLPPEGD
jgi:catechol 2,3-dioxygenase-like lactoylglutathione lyase family enzyme